MIILWGCGTAQRAQKTTAPWEVLSAEGYAQVGGAPGGGGGNVVYTLKLKNRLKTDIWVVSATDSVGALVLEPAQLQLTVGGEGMLRGFRSLGGPTLEGSSDRTGASRSPSSFIEITWQAAGVGNPTQTTRVQPILRTTSKPID